MDLSAMPKVFSGQHSWYSATFQSISKTTTNVLSTTKLLYTYNHVINGFRASLTPDELEAIKSSSGYLFSIKDLPIKPDTIRSAHFLGLNTKSRAWLVSKYGHNVIVVVDTEIWPKSESFHDRGMPNIPSRWKGKCEIGTEFNSSLCNKKLIGARYFNKGLIANNPNITISMNSTRNVDGHETHTSSTAVGNSLENASYFGYASSTAGGMAPRARVAMHKALWVEDAYSSDVIATIDQTINDGVDVLSMSLGLAGLALYEDPLAIATFAAIEKNILVSTFAKNLGPHLEILHNVIPWVLAIAAGIIDRELGAIITLGNGVKVLGLSLYPSNSSLSNFPIVFMDDSFNLTKLRAIREKIVVCQDKNRSISDQVYNIATTKVAGDVFISDINDLEFYIRSSCPAVSINPKKGEIVKDYVFKNSTEPKARMEFQITIVGSKEATVVT